MSIASPMHSKGGVMYEKTKSLLSLPHSRLPVAVIEGQIKEALKRTPHNPYAGIPLIRSYLNTSHFNDLKDYLLGALKRMAEKSSRADTIMAVIQMEFFNSVTTDTRVKLEWLGISRPTYTSRLQDGISYFSLYLWGSDGNSPDPTILPYLSLVEATQKEE